MPNRAAGSRQGLGRGLSSSLEPGLAGPGRAGEAGKYRPGMASLAQPTCSRIVRGRLLVFRLIYYVSAYILRTGGVVVGRIAIVWVEW